MQNKPNATGWITTVAVYSGDRAYSYPVYRYRMNGKLRSVSLKGESQVERVTKAIYQRETISSILAMLGRAAA